MDGYLLDNNIINFWHNSRLPKHEQVREYIARLPDGTPLFTSVAVIGEIEDGLRRIQSPTWNVDQQQQALREFIDQHFPHPLPITRHTAVEYGKLRSAIVRYVFGGKRCKTPPPKWCDPVKGTELGITENDLWIAAQAVERKLILVTHRGMTNIKQVMPDELMPLDWAA